MRLEELVVIDDCILTEFAGWRSLSDRPSFPVESVTVSFWFWLWFLFFVLFLFFFCSVWFWF